MPCASGSDRLAEACTLLGLDGGDIVVNVQGDEPLIDPALIDAVAAALAAHPEAAMSTAAHEIDSLADFLNPNVVKAVLDAQGNALYFSRLRTGARPGRIPTLEETEAHDWTQLELAFAHERAAGQAFGSLESATASITELVASTQADEVIVVPQGPGLETKLRTLRELSA